MIRKLIASSEIITLPYSLLLLPCNTHLIETRLAALRQLAVVFENADFPVIFALLRNTDREVLTIVVADRALYILQIVPQLVDSADAFPLLGAAAETEVAVWFAAA